LRSYAHSCTLLRMNGNNRVNVVGVEVLGMLVEAPAGAPYTPAEPLHGVLD
jgi:hypothetical protein